MKKFLLSVTIICGLVLTSTIGTTQSVQAKTVFRVSAFGHKKTGVGGKYCDGWCCGCVVVRIEIGESSPGEPWPTISTYPQDIMNEAQYDSSLDGMVFTGTPQSVSGYTGVYRIDDGNGPIMYYMDFPIHTQHNDGTNSELLRFIRNLLGI